MSDDTDHAMTPEVRAILANAMPHHFPPPSVKIAHLTVENAALQAKIAECEEYLKQGETPRQRMDRDHADVLSLMRLLGREKQRVELATAALEEIVRQCGNPIKSQPVSNERIIERNEETAMNALAEMRVKE